MALTAALAAIALEAPVILAGFGPAMRFVPPPDQAEAAPLPAAAPPAQPQPQSQRLPPQAPFRGPRSLLPIRNIEMHEPTVALTFDACATRSHRYTFDRKVFDILKREGLPATIFVSGRWVEGHPDVMAELSVDPLIEFGDHSYDHPHMSHLPVARIVEEIDQTEAALARYGKHSVAFRPPFGEWSSRLIYVVQDLQLPTVTWDVVSGDPSARTTTEGMIRNVVGKARPGSIVVFHINGRGLKTAQALPTIVHQLRERGFRFVHVSDLMASGRAAPIPVAPVAATPAAPMPIPVSPIPAAISRVRPPPPMGPP
jgi:peptidoglycan/xylan/chitin deacetylase (PgdA/CDA1 family)